MVRIGIYSVFIHVFIVDLWKSICLYLLLIYQWNLMICIIYVFVELYLLYFIGIFMESICKCIY